MAQKLTYTVLIDLPDDEFDRAEIIAKTKGLEADIEAAATKRGVLATTSHSFDGRKAPRDSAKRSLLQDEFEHAARQNVEHVVKQAAAE